jgi:hypothetical protein
MSDEAFIREEFCSPTKNSNLFQPTVNFIGQKERNVDNKIAGNSQV